MKQKQILWFTAGLMVIFLLGAGLDRPTANLSTSTGNLPIERLNGGTGADTTTFWRGDGTWGIPSVTGAVATAGLVMTESNNVLNGANTFTATTTNNILIITNSLKVRTMTYPTSDGSSNQVMTTFGGGTLGFTTVTGGSGAATNAANNWVAQQNFGTIQVTNVDYTVGAQTSTSGETTSTNTFSLMGASYQTLNLTNQTFVNFSNPRATLIRAMALKVTAATTNNLIIPSFHRLSGSITNSIPLGKVAVLSVTYFDDQNTNAVSSYVLEQ